MLTTPDSLEPVARSLRRIGRYRVRGVLGRGGMGVVYYARDADGRPVAVKVIRPEMADDNRYRTRFGREITAAMRVDSRFCASVIEAGPDAEIPYLVSEYVAGPTLADFVAHSGPLTVEAVYALAAGLAQALADLGDAGVIHRDLKPTNVILSADGPRVIDFGLARTDDATPMTVPGRALGTPGYMAPEQVGGYQAAPAADVHSWGAVTAFSASGHHPFGDGPGDAIAYRIVHEPPRLDGLVDPVRALVEKAMRKDPLDRPSASFLAGRLVNVRPDAPTREISANVTRLIDRTWIEPTLRESAPRPVAAAVVPPASKTTRGRHKQAPAPGRARRLTIGAASAVAALVLAAATAAVADGPFRRGTETAVAQSVLAATGADEVAVEAGGRSMVWNTLTGSVPALTMTISGAQEVTLALEDVEVDRGLFFGSPGRIVASAGSGSVSFPFGDLQSKLSASGYSVQLHPSPRGVAATGRLLGVAPVPVNVELTLEGNELVVDLDDEGLWALDLLTPAAAEVRYEISTLPAAATLVDVRSDAERVTLEIDVDELSLS